jgi:hypothetical protein
MHNLREALQRLALVMVCFGLRVDSIQAQQELSTAVDEALQHNAAALSPLTVTWERERSSRANIATVLSVIGLPKTSIEFLSPEKVHLVWDRGKFYSHFWRQMPTMLGNGSVDPKAPLHVQEQEISCDGNSIYNGDPPRPETKRLGHTVLIVDSLQKLARDSARATWLRAEYLYSAGYAMPSNSTDLRGGERPRSLLLSALQGGGKLTRRGEPVPIEGQTFEVWEVSKDGERQVYFLDPGRNYVLRRRQVFAKAGNLAAQTDCLDFVQLPHTKLWAPRRIATDMYYPQFSATEPLVKQQFIVSEIRDDPVPADRFVLAYTEPGTVVADSRIPGADKTSGERITYQVPADPGRLDEVIDAATRGLQPKPRWLLNSRSWFVVANAGIALMVGVWWLIARRYRRRTA